MRRLQSACRKDPLQFVVAVLIVVDRHCTHMLELLFKACNLFGAAGTIVCSSKCAIYLPHMLFSKLMQAMSNT
jgi:hypothetical protein